MLESGEHVKHQPVAAGKAVTLHGVLPKFDPRSWPAYAILGVLAAAAYVCLALTGLRFSVAGIWLLSAVSLAAIFAAWMLRRAGRSALSSGLETVGVAYLVSMAGLVIQHPLMALPFPLADGLLSRMDHALGFDWPAFTQFFVNRGLWLTMVFAYCSMILQCLLLLVLLNSTGRDTRAWTFVTAASLAMATTMIILPFFPADGSLALCSTPRVYPWVMEGACDYSSIIHQLKEGQINVLGPSELVGLVSFPSFHTAIGLQFIWAFWPYKWLRWPMAAINVLLVCGAIVIGSHYFVDIVAGGLVGIASIAIAKRLVGSPDTVRLRPPLPSDFQTP